MLACFLCDGDRTICATQCRRELSLRATRKLRGTGIEVVNLNENRCLFCGTKLHNIFYSCPECLHITYCSKAHWLADFSRHMQASHEK